MSHSFAGDRDKAAPDSSVAAASPAIASKTPRLDDEVCADNAQPGRGLLGSIASGVSSTLGPTLVLVGFGTVFLLGHHYQWRVPSFSELSGSHGGPSDDWCLEHAVPESMCVECNPKLMPPGPDYQWCAEHGVHNCSLHHPDVTQLKTPPSESELANDLQRAERALAIAPRKQNNSRCDTYKARIQFASLEAVKQAGVDVALVERKPITESLSALGEIVYDPTRQASLASRLPGSVWAVKKQVGDPVTQGELLALVDAAQVGDLKTNLLRSLAEEKLQQHNVSRLNAAGDVIAGARLLDANAALAKAHADVLSAEQSLRNLGLSIQVDRLREMTEQQVMERLRLLGIPEQVRATIAPQNLTSNLLPIVSPIDGVVIQCRVTPGEVVDPTRILFQVADTRQMWLQLSVPLEHADQLAIGQSIRFTPDGSQHTVAGRLDWISTSADPQTRMLEVRSVLENTDHRLLNETFGKGDIVVRQESAAVVIPNGSFHWDGCCQVVFVRDLHYFDSPESPKVFHVRSVRLGASSDGFTEVIAGVAPGEVIATDGSDVLKAQLLKNNLGAGCDCCAHPGG